MCFSLSLSNQKDSGSTVQKKMFRAMKIVQKPKNTILKNHFVSSIVLITTNQYRCPRSELLSLCFSLFFRPFRFFSVRTQEREICAPTTACVKSTREVCLEGGGWGSKRGDGRVGRRVRMSATKLVDGGLTGRRERRAFHGLASATSCFQAFVVKECA